MNFFKRKRHFNQRVDVGYMIRLRNMFGWAYNYSELGEKRELVKGTTGCTAIAKGCASVRKSGQVVGQIEQGHQKARRVVAIFATIRGHKHGWWR